jgi:hypothetical protein
MNDIATLARLSHADSHAGPFEECREHLCPELRRRLWEYAATEAAIQAVRGAR